MTRVYPLIAPVLLAAFPLGVHGDPRDARGSALDLRRASFEQRGSQVYLRLRTQTSWSAGHLAPGELCVRLVGAHSTARICVGSDGAGRPALFLGPRRLRAVVVRHDRRSLEARFYPVDLHRRFARWRWSLVSRANGQVDRLPDRGRFTMRTSSFGAPPCFGAAARAHGYRCANPALRRSVVPAPSAAELMPDAACEPQPSQRYPVAVPCRFGHPAGGPPTVALIGDSHTAHWRAALDVAAKAAGWSAVSLTHPGCAFSTEAYPAPAPIPARCRQHSRDALHWLRSHPSVRTVVTSSAAGRGLSPGGFAAIWREVPPTVRRIFVIRDVPRVSYATAGCVRAVRLAHHASLRACSVSRTSAFPADPSAQAAVAAGGRVRLLDFSRFFCDRSRCYPVIGGAYVYRDFNHMNPVFNATLGPYLLRAIRR